MLRTLIFFLIFAVQIEKFNCESVGIREDVLKSLGKVVVDGAENILFSREDLKSPEPTVNRALDLGVVKTTSLAGDEAVLNSGEAMGDAIIEGGKTIPVVGKVVQTDDDNDIIVWKLAKMIFGYESSSQNIRQPKLKNFTPRKFEPSKPTPNDIQNHVEKELTKEYAKKKIAEKLGNALTHMAENIPVVGEILKVQAPIVNEALDAVIVKTTSLAVDEGGKGVQTHDVSKPAIKLLENGVDTLKSGVIGALSWFINV